MPKYGKKIFQRFNGTIDMIEQDKFKLDIYSTLDTLVPSTGEVTEDMIGLSDNTTDNVTSAKHGFAPKSPADATTFLNGAATPAYAQVKDSDLATTDVTTNNASTSKHGFQAKGTASTSTFYRSDNTQASVSDANLSVTDITTNDVSSAAHGFAPKGSNLSIPNVIMAGKSNGTGTSITSITVSAGVATVTQTAHGYITGDAIAIAGATGAGVGDINQLHTITNTGANTYTFVTTATGTIAGTILSMYRLVGTRSYNTTLIKNIVRGALGNLNLTLTNTQSDAFYGITYGLVSNNANNLIAYTGTGAPTTTTFNVQVLNAANTAFDPTSYFQILLTGII